MHYRVSVSRAFLQGYLLIACCLGGAIAARGQTQTAGLAGTWAGVLRSSRDVHIVLHISGPDSALTATQDSPDQNTFGNHVDSITFAASALTFEISGLSARFKGNLMTDGSIEGIFVQPGLSFNLVLRRSEGQESRHAITPSDAPSRIDGIWGGVLKSPTQSLRFFIHISGLDSDLTATCDSPDQDRYGRHVDSITFAAPHLTFEMFPIQARFSGDLMADGSISGTFFQHGSTGIPLVLTRSQSVPDPPASGRVENGRYHHDQTGLEFDVPPGFSVLGTGDYINNEGWQATLTDSGHSAVAISVWMAKRNTPSKLIPTVLAQEIPHKIARRSVGGQTYEIPGESVQMISINGQQGIQAIGRFEQSSRKMVELLAWIHSEHTVAHFYAILPAAKLSDVQMRFDQMVESATIP